MGLGGKYKEEFREPPIRGWLDEQDYLEKEMQQSLEHRARYGDPLFKDKPSAEHLEEFICAGCKAPLGLGIAHGVNGKSYHPGCAEKVINEMKTRNQGVKK